MDIPDTHPAVAAAMQKAKAESEKPETPPAPVVTVAEVTAPEPILAEVPLVTAAEPILDEIPAGPAQPLKVETPVEEPETAPAIVASEPSAAPETDKPIIMHSNAWLVNCLDSAVVRINLSSDNEAVKNGDLVRLSQPCIPRPHVFVGKVIDYKRAIFDFVTSIDKLRALLSEVTSIELESAYTGEDAANVMVFRCGLPQGYVARIPYIRLRDVPQIYFDRDQVLAKKTRTPSGATVIESLCRELEPMWTDRPHHDTTRVKMQFYNCITVKISRRTSCIVRWFPGVDVNYQPCLSYGDQFVLVGPHYSKRPVAKKFTSPNYRNNHQNTHHQNGRQMKWGFQGDFKKELLKDGRLQTELSGNAVRESFEPQEQQQ